MVFEFEGVSDALPTCVDHDRFYASIMVKSGCDVPTGYGVVAPCSASAGLVMDKDFGAGWRHGCGIE